MLNHPTNLTMMKLKLYGNKVTVKIAAPNRTIVDLKFTYIYSSVQRGSPNRTME